VVDGSSRWLILVCVDKIVDGFGSNNPTKTIMNVLLKDLGANQATFFQKDFFFGSIWNECFSRGEIGMTKQIKGSWTPFFYWVFLVLFIGLTWQSNPWVI
jgi:hypothetical protein